MAETPSQTPAPTPTPTPSVSDTSDYWCYHCNKRVSVETVENLPDIICHECKNGFVESIPATSPPPSLTPDQVDDPSFGDQFLQVLRLISQAAREDDAPPPQSQDPQSEDDFLRIELDGWDNDEDEDDDDDDDDEEEEEANENEMNRNGDEDDEEEGNENRRGEEEEERSDNENEENRDDDDDDDDDEDDLRRRRRDVLRLRIRDFATRARSGRNRILDWAEILMGLEDNTIEYHLEIPASDRYVGNPEDYVDAAGYEALLQNLAESDGGRRGAPPAAKSAVSELSTVVIGSESESMLCAICKDMVNVSETATKLPCGHGYHGDCIVPWLGSRNSCPVCRFELPTDDPEYEEERKKRVVASVGADAGSSGDNSGSG